MIQRSTSIDFDRPCRLALVLAALLATSASAHPLLEHAQPGAGASVPMPREIVLNYSETLEPAFSGVTVVDLGGHDVTSATAAISGSTMEIQLKALKPGAYRVTWHAVSVDTHRTEGSYRFTVTP